MKLTMRLRAFALLLVLPVVFSPSSLAQGSKRAPAQRAAARAQGEAVIMQQMYGNYDARTKTSQWIKPTKAALEMMGLNAGPLISRMGGAFPFQEGGNKKLLFVTWSVPRNFDCHGCSPLVSVAVFSQGAGKWEIEATESALTTSGAWGAPGTFKLEQVGTERFALVVNSAFTAQGQTSEAAFFYVREGAKFKQALVLNLQEDNGGMCGAGGHVCYSYESKYAFQPKGTEPYYDLLVTATGTRLNDKGKVVKAKPKQTYVFKDGEYKPAS